jgi:hypothetical protein
VVTLLIPYEEAHANLMNGLFNEVMSSAIHRSSEFQNLDESVLESIA